MAEYVEVARLDELPPGRGTHVPDYGVQTYLVKVVEGKIMIALVTPPSAT